MKSLAFRRAPVPSYPALLSICCTISLACYFGAYMRIPVVPLFAGSLGASTVEVGLINSSFLVMAGILSLPLGILSDRLGRKLLIIVGLLISSLTSFLLCFSRAPMQLVAIYLFFGAGLAAFAPTMMSFVADFSPSTHLGRSYGWYTMSLYGGMSLGPAAGGLVAQELGFRPVFLISGLLIFAVLWIVVFFLPRARHVLVNRPPKPKLSVAGRELLKNRPLWGCWLATLGGCFGLGMFVTFIPLHAHDRGLNMGEIGLIFGIQASFNALSRIPFGQLSDKVGNRASLVVLGLIGFAASMAGFAFSSNLITFLLVAVAFGVSMGVAFTALGALISEVVAPQSRGLAMGGYNASIYLGMMLSSLVMGALIPSIGFPRAFLATGFINLLTNGVFYVMIKGFVRCQPAGSER